MNFQKLDDVLTKIFSPYINKSIDEIFVVLGKNSTAKNRNNVLIRSIIENSSSMSDFSDLRKECSISLKTVKLDWNQNIKESMSLSTFNYKTIVDENWETCKLRDFFSTTTFVFFIFQRGINKVIFSGYKIWKMPINILDSGVKDTWENTKEILKDGNIVRYVDKRNRYITNFLTSGDTKYIHVRPHAANMNDTFDLPVPDKITGKTSFVKHSFWLNSNFIKRIISGQYDE